jgi:hypothetical protein
MTSSYHIVQHRSNQFQKRGPPRVKCVWRKTEFLLKVAWKKTEFLLKVALNSMETET